jgi:hypothetical protein
MPFLSLVPEPELPVSLDELDQEHWEVLNTLYYRNRPYEPEESLRAALERKGLLEGTKLTELGEKAHDRMHRYLAPWDYTKDGKVWKSCAVIVSDGNYRDLLLHACGPSIDWHIEQYGWSCEELDMHAPEPGIWVWEGSMGCVRVTSPDYGEDWEFEVNGDFRRPTDEEWEKIQDQECPWDKGNLPKWEKKRG